MKYGGIQALCLVILALITVSTAYGQEKAVDLASIVLESFGGDVEHEWNDGRYQRNFEFAWEIAASKFATKSTDADGNETSFPQMLYVDAWPISLFGYNREGREIKSLGIHGRFDRRGYNWVDVYPVTTDGDRFEIPMPGRIRYIDLWVWSANLNYYMEAYVRDFQGVVHTVSLGTLAHSGWRNLRASMPTHIQQSRRTIPNLAALRFVKFRIWTQPTEQVADFYVYFKQFKVLTDVFESIFDGDDLADPDHVPQLWANGTGGGTN
ncbi:MAG: flagellar filament outer layer protein FlaA [Treponema sp.]|jgi:hypothetical protein|nr:flagellar filament outer layer protein FlaA [Treponema sp.]